jgi:ketosteroid isomerase-like protein
MLSAVTDRPPDFARTASDYARHRAGFPQEQLLHRAYAAFNARDIDGALAMMHANVDWPNGMDGGRVHGHREVREYWRRQFDLIDSRVEPQRIEQQPNGQVVVMVRQVVRDRTGNVISEDTVEHWYVISEGLIERMDIHDH